MLLSTCFILLFLSVQVMHDGRTAQDRLCRSFWTLSEHDLVIIAQVGLGKGLL